MRRKQINKMPFRTHDGFTLIELLIAMAISGIVMIAIYTAYQSQVRSSTAQGQISEMQQNIRAALDVMVREIRMAGYDPDGIGTAGITTAGANQLAFILVADDDGLDNDNADGDDNSSTGADEPGELKRISYVLYDAYGDGDFDLGRQVGTVASTKRALAENIERIEFMYLDSTGSTTGILTNIDSIQISILARSAYKARNFTNTTPYTSASGADWSSNDNYRRRLLITRVQCRNIGI